MSFLTSLARSLEGLARRENLTPEQLELRDKIAAAAKIGKIVCAALAVLAAIGIPGSSGALALGRVIAAVMFYDYFQACSRVEEYCSQYFKELLVGNEPDAVVKWILEPTIFLGPAMTLIMPNSSQQRAYRG